MLSGSHPRSAISFSLQNAMCKHTGTHEAYAQHILHLWAYWTQETPPKIREIVTIHNVFSELLILQWPCGSWSIRCLCVYLSWKGPPCQTLPSRTGRTPARGSQKLREQNCVHTSVQVDTYTQKISRYIHFNICEYTCVCKYLNIHIYTCLCVCFLFCRCKFFEVLQLRAHQKNYYYYIYI